MKGLRQNIRVGIAYQYGRSEGQGCVAFENLMEDLATLEISRAQVWQWLYHKVTLDEGVKVTKELVSTLFDEEYQEILSLYEGKEEKLKHAKEVIKEIFLKPDLTDFFTEL